MKKLISVVTAALSFLMIGMTFGLSACTRSVPDNDQFLEVYVLDVGYGYEMIEDLLDSFSKTDYVQENYPEFDYIVNHNAEWDFAADRIEGGPRVNSADLLMSTNLQNLADTTYNGISVLEPLDDVYQTKVDGDLTVEGKMFPSYLEPNKDNDGHYVSIPWAAYIYSIIYNATLFDELNLEVPVTTDEMIEICETVKSWQGNKSEYPYTYTWMQSSNTGYWKRVFPYWWGMYEGIDNLKDFYSGISENRLSPNIFRQQGRLESLNVMDACLSGNNGYLDPSANVYSFMNAQTNFLMGKGLMMVCGDWFDYEMRIVRDGLIEQGYNYDIRMMRIPVISSIVNKTPSITELAEKEGKEADEVLSAVVKAIDNGATQYDSVDQDDFNFIRSARLMMDGSGALQNAVVPSYATAKDLAKDFLRYMATEEGNLIYAKTTNGATLPYYYYIEEIDPELYSNFSLIEKDKQEIQMNKDLQPVLLPDASSYPLFRAGLSEMYSLGTDTFESYLNDVGDDRPTGADLYYADIAYWTTDRFQSILANAGI